MTTAGRKGLARRDFLKSSAGLALAAATSNAWGEEAADTTQKVRLGIVGCGNRGVWLGKLFEESGHAKVVALHDYFRDRVTSAAKAFQVEENRQFVGLEGYRPLLAEPIDAVAIISPPYFHPEQAMAAVEANKHVYLAKPVAVDAPGCATVLAAGRKAADKSRCFLVDFQTRNNEFFRGAAQRVHEGMIGTPACGQAYYECGRLGTQCPPGTETARLRNWVFDKALSGDIIVEQNIHVLDVANWFLNTHPEHATGTGARSVRTDVGDCWDNFSVTYSYPGGVTLSFCSRQFGDGFDDLCTRIYGATGTVDAHYGGDVRIRGQHGGWAGGKTPDIYREGAFNNIKDFCAAVAAKTPLNNAVQAAESTLTCILGRMAAYSGETVTWAEMLDRNERLDPKLALPRNGPDSTT